MVQNIEGNWGSSILKAIRGLHNGVFFTITSRYPIGTNIFESDWDLIIVLDACRVDAMQEVAPKFDFITNVNSIWSVGSASHEWLCKTFTQEYSDVIQKTAYLSTNPFHSRTFRERSYPPSTYTIPVMWADWNVVDADRFQFIERVSKSSEKGYHATTPNFVTDRAIDVGRNQQFDRMIVHYFQPHRPFIGKAYPEDRPVTDVEDRPWDSIRDGAATRDAVWELYIDNLEFVLNSVERLLRNFDAETVVITSDHANLFGELGLYGHPEGLVHPSLKKVPWVETTATDMKTSTPEFENDEYKNGIDAEEQLRDLGYV